MVIEENFPFDREEHKRWLYTACTRAAEKLVLVR
jgi:ATP-dependent exoDNAse (exonuclease V) beta subunit